MCESTDAQLRKEVAALTAALRELLHYARNCGADHEMLDRASAALGDMPIPPD